MEWLVVERSRRYMDRGRQVYRWRCLLCKRFGYHRPDRFEDRVRAARGAEPDLHPWQRAVNAAARHFHQRHTPCTCCSTRHRPEVRAAA
jgi:hypothetical protein